MAKGKDRRLLVVTALVVAACVAALALAPERFWRSSVAPFAQKQVALSYVGHLGGFAAVQDWPQLAKYKAGPGKTWADFRQAETRLVWIPPQRRSASFDAAQAWLRQQCASQVAAACVDLAVATAAGHFGPSDLRQAIADIPTKGRAATSEHLMSLKARLAQPCSACTFWVTIDAAIARNGHPFPVDLMRSLASGRKAD